MSSVTTSICLQYRGFPIYVINAIAAYATTGRWIFLYDNEGNFVRKLNLAGFDKISRNISYKAESYEFVSPHAVHYNGLVFYPRAITHVHPTIQNENGVMMSRSYTSVEVAPEMFDYILINERKDDGVGDWTPRDAYVFRPYCDHPIGRAQSIHRYHEDNDLNITDIHFELWVDGWEWEPFHGIDIEDEFDDFMEEWVEAEEEEYDEEQEENARQWGESIREALMELSHEDYAWWSDEEYEEVFGPNIKRAILFPK